MKVSSPYVRTPFRLPFSSAQLGFLCLSVFIFGYSIAPNKTPSISVIARIPLYVAQYHQVIATPRLI